MRTFFRIIAVLLVLPLIPAAAGLWWLGILSAFHDLGILCGLAVSVILTFFCGTSQGFSWFLFVTMWRGEY